MSIQYRLSTIFIYSATVKIDFCSETKKETSPVWAQQRTKPKPIYWREAFSWQTFSLAFNKTIDLNVLNKYLSLGSFGLYKNFMYAFKLKLKINFPDINFVSEYSEELVKTNSSASLF